MMTNDQASAIVARVHALASEAADIARQIPDDCNDHHGLMLKGFLLSVSGTLKSGDMTHLRDAFVSMGGVSERWIASLEGPTN